MRAADRSPQSKKVPAQPAKYGRRRLQINLRSDEAEQSFASI
jgi:hypothetical protein